MVKIRVETDKAFENMVIKARGLTREVDEAARLAMELSAMATVSTIKSSGRVPRKTSNLMRSIRHRTHGRRIGNLWAEVGTNVVYARIHEFGGPVHRTQAWGRPTRPYVAIYKERRYLRGGLQDSTHKIGQIFRRELEKATDLQ